MEIRLRPELASLIEDDVKRGPYASVSDFVEHAVSLLHEQETWLAANRDDVQARIEEGYAAAAQGELLDDDQARARLADLKRARSAKPQRG